jgi:ABC-2 type transport system permease protein
MVASVAKGQQSLSGLANVTSLGLCFLGGVFVPIQFLGEGIVKVAKFLPTYWYEINVDMLGEYLILNQEQKIKYMNGIYVQIAVAAMFVTIALFINSKKDSHVN